MKKLSLDEKAEMESFLRKHSIKNRVETRKDRSLDNPAGGGGGGGFSGSSCLGTLPEDMVLASAEVKVVTVFCGTWNIGEKCVDSTVDLSSWLAVDEEPPDIYAIAFQELDMSVQSVMFNSQGGDKEEWSLQAVFNSLHHKATYKIAK